MKSEKPMTDCKHDWKDTRPTRSDATLGPPPDNDIIPCTKCGTPLLLPRRTGLWRGTVNGYTGDLPLIGPPWHYCGTPNEQLREDPDEEP
jgi:hypothetical protein